MPHPNEEEDSLPAPSDRSSAAAAPDQDDESLFRTGRVHISARQRGADFTALVGLALHLPQVLASTVVVFAASYVLEALGGPPWWLPLGSWALSGGLVFHRPCERLLARWLFGLRYPTPQESYTLRAVWGEVSARAGVNGEAYQLWVQDSEEINAMATAGHIVSVTSRSLRTLAPSRLAGVLAHELGHHTRGHAWSTLLSFWYALPGRLTWRLLLRLASRIGSMSAGATIITVALLGAAVITLATMTYGLIFLPLLTPCLMAAVSRRSELRADKHAASLGFAPQLMAVLGEECSQKGTGRADRAVLGSPQGKESMIARLLASHPDVHTRLHHLQVRRERGH
jgi:Zn-dependent protease with chaperone function